MKSAILVLLLPCILFAIEIYDSNETYSYTASEIKAMKDTVFSHTIYKAKTKQKITYKLKGQWLQVILKSFGHPKSPYDGITIIASDGYRSEIKGETFRKARLFLAWEIDDKPPKEGDFHLYAMDVLNMYSVKAPAKIILIPSSEKEMKVSELYIMDDTLKNLKLTTGVGGYSLIEGISFSTLLHELGIKIEDSDTLTGFGLDGIKHTYPYKGYLDGAGLFKDESGKWALRGKQLLQGMWLKEFTCFVYKDRVYFLISMLDKKRLSGVWDLLQIKNDIKFNGQGLISRDEASKYTIQLSPQGIYLLEGDSPERIDLESFLIKQKE